MPEGSRIDPNDVVVNGKPLDKLKTYTITTKEYISHGKDGFNEFLNMKVIRDDEQSFDLCDAVIKIFRELQPESTFCSSPFVKQKSSDLMSAGLIVAAVR